MQCRNNIASDTLTNALKQPDTLSEDSNDVHIPKLKGAHHARDHSQEDGGGSDNSQGKKRDKKDAYDTSSDGSKRALSINSQESSNNNLGRGGGKNSVKRKRNKFNKSQWGAKDRQKEGFRGDK